MNLSIWHLLFEANPHIRRWTQTWTNLLWIPNPTSQIFLITSPFVCWPLGGSFSRTASSSPNPTNSSPPNLLKRGHSGCEVRVTTSRTEIITPSIHTQEVPGDKAHQICELTPPSKHDSNSLGPRWNYMRTGFTKGVECSERLRSRLLSGLAVRRCSFTHPLFFLLGGNGWVDGSGCCGVLPFIREFGANGVRGCFFRKTSSCLCQVHEIRQWMIQCDQPVLLP